MRITLARLAGDAIVLALATAATTIAILILLGDCGPDGTGQAECLADWGAAARSVAARALDIR
jgi:hypothetical protein